ncbi:MAG: glycerate kinase [Candidatus Hodarchaeota archaeon]
MWVLNAKDLLKNASSKIDREARKAALRILAAALDSLDPRTVVKTHVHRVNEILKIDNLTFNLDNFKRVFVVGGGKASGAMAEAIEEILGSKITGGFVNILRGTKLGFKTNRIILNEAGHPIPDEDGMNGAKSITELVKKADRNDLIICLISGGGSALMPLPAGNITLQEKQNLTNNLLRCGGTIQEINVVRKHVSELKGGQLAKIAYPATLVGLILSDVVGDRLGTIASGPTVPDTTTFNDAIAILKKYDLWKSDIPESIKKRLISGMREEIPETPKPDESIFERTHNVIVGNNRLAAFAAHKEAKRLGFNALVLSTAVEGEARHVGTIYAGIITEILVSGNPIPKPAVVIAGGETTVTVTGRGKGGRNQELVLGTSLKINGLRGIAIASIDTDGVDGFTDAAGAIADGETMAHATKIGLNTTDFLENNDSYNFFSRVGDLIFTGPTGTNVNDLSVIVVM